MGGRSPPRSIRRKMRAMGKERGSGSNHQGPNDEQKVGDAAGEIEAQPSQLQRTRSTRRKMRALGSKRANGSSATDARTLSDQLTDRKWWTRHAAVVEIEADSSLLQECRSEIVRLLSDSRWQVRAVAIQAVSKDAKLRTECGELLAGLLWDEYPHVRAKAAIAIGQDRALLHMYWDEVSHLLRDEANFVRSAARNATQYSEANARIKRRLTTGGLFQDLTAAMVCECPRVRS
jgi:hypothetical protein